MSTNKSLLIKFSLGCALLLALHSTTEAQVTGYNIFEEDFLTQTGPSTVTSSDWTFTANLTLANAGDASTVSLTAPSSTVYDLSPNPTDATAYQYRQNFGAESDMTASFPTGATYSFAISGGGLGSDSGSLTFPPEGTDPGDLSYPSSVPIFTNYAAIQNINASQAFTFTFPGFDALTGVAQTSNLFLDIRDASGAVVFSDDFLPSTTTSVTVGANTFAPGTLYTASLDYSNRQTTDDDGFTASGDGVDPFAGLDYNTGLTFTTDFVPEPSSAWLILVGVGFLALRRKLQAS
jgi:PEP-CTERM motif